MVDRIERLYAGPVGPVSPSDKPAKVQRTDSGEEPVPVRMPALPIAARLIPNLRDTVEISQEAREAADAHGIGGVEAGVSEIHRKAISDSWYATGYLHALELIDKG